MSSAAGRDKVWETPVFQPGGDPTATPCFQPEMEIMSAAATNPSSGGERVGGGKVNMMEQISQLDCMATAGVWC